MSEPVLTRSTTTTTQTTIEIPWFRLQHMHAGVWAVYERACNPTNLSDEFVAWHGGGSISVAREEIDGLVAALLLAKEQIP